MLRIILFHFLNKKYDDSSHAFSLPIKNVHVYNNNAKYCESGCGDVSRCD